MKYKSIVAFLLLSLVMISCGESKEDLRDTIEEQQERISELENELEEKEQRISELEEKLENVASYASDVQNSIDNARYYGNRFGDVDDAEDALSSIESESDY